MGEHPAANPLMVMLLASNSFLGSAEQVENLIMQLPDQLNFTPGDCAILASANTQLEHDFGLVKMLDASEHAEEYPDWEERLLNSFVLCEHFSRLDPEITIGWFNRLKLLKIPKYRYKEAKRWMKDGFPDQMPDWVTVAHHKYTDQLHERAPTVVPKAVICPSCRGRHVKLKVIRAVTYTAHCGVLEREEDHKEIYRPVEDAEVESTHTVRLVCEDCHATAVIDDDDEWEIPGLTN